MSKPEPSQREWRFFIQDMIEFGEKAMFFTEGLDQDAFIADELTYNATLRKLEHMGNGDPTRHANEQQKLQRRGAQIAPDNAQNH